MNFKIVVLAFVCVVGISNIHAASPMNKSIQQRAEQALNEQIAKFRATSAARDGVADCYPYYSKIFAELFEEFDNDNKKIGEKKEQEQADLSNAGEEKRKEVAKAIQDVSNALSVCGSEEANENYFDCVEKEGNKGSRTIWTASRDSLEFAAYIREESHEIEARADKAEKEAERKYIVARTKANDDMMNCFTNGGIIPSTDGPSTEDPSTGEPSTQEPSTEDPSTGEPSTQEPSTQEPSTQEPSTQEPSTEAPSTEAPSTEAPSTEEPSTEAPTESPEGDQVEELEENQHISARKRLEDFMKNWGKRF